jgi:hypothetical protein
MMKRRRRRRAILPLHPNVIPILILNNEEMRGMERRGN